MRPPSPRLRRAKEDGGQNFALRIAKLGTRPKGGSPKDNLEIVGPVTVPAEREHSHEEI